MIRIQKSEVTVTAQTPHRNGSTVTLVLRSDEDVEAGDLPPVVARIECDEDSGLAELVEADEEYVLEVRRGTLDEEEKMRQAKLKAMEQAKELSEEHASERARVDTRLQIAEEVIAQDREALHEYMERCGEQGGQMSDDKPKQVKVDSIADCSPPPRKGRWYNQWSCHICGQRHCDPKGSPRCMGEFQHQNFLGQVFVPDGEQ
ncbi:MAG: hypothetical protein U5L04_01770 [Trueperaceae bacterium]|nr:hypothetical protein [Trueperaceae bacterium]